MPVLDRYILFSFLRTFISFFLILMLIFVVQTVWVFIDEFAGKGLDITVLLRFLLYYSPKLIPLVLPLTVLLASIMTYGSLAEHYEFAALKSAGVSLTRSMRSVFVVSILLSGIAFYVANTVVPYAEFKTYNLRKNLAKIKPALAISEGVFNDLGESNIKVEEKYGPNDRFLTDVIIHQKTADMRNSIVVKSDEGELKNADFSDGIQLVLTNGNRYEELKPKRADRHKKRYPHSRVSFGTYTMNIDLRDFNNVDLDETKYTNTYKMQDIDRLSFSIDSLENIFTNDKESYAKTTYVRTGVKSIHNTSEKEIRDYEGVDSVLSNYKIYALQSIIRQVESKLNTLESNLNNQKKTFFFKTKIINLHKIWYYDKFIIAFSVLLMFLIGAPLGALIRKGGFGLPMVLALLIFLSYHFGATFFKNTAEDGSISPFVGTTSPTIVLFVLSLVMIKRAREDKGMFGFSNLTAKLITFWRAFIRQATSVKRIFTKN
ncbi:MAG: LptF/LptG family permease [Flavobacteriaceae bacterium]